MAMNAQDLARAEGVCIGFLETALRLRGVWAEHNSAEWQGILERDCKRASMDLTRALAKLRKPE